MPPESLLEQYLASSYRVEHGETTVRFRVGVRSRDLARLLQSRGASTCAFITAWNPGSRPLDESENRARNEALRQDARAKGFELLHALGESPDGDWSEQSYLILGVARGEALELARKYGQLAFLHADADGLPELVLCDAEPA